MSEVNTVRLNFLAGELGLLPEGKPLNIKEHMVTMAEDQLSGLKQFFEDAKGSNGDALDYEKNWVEEAEADLHYAHMTTEGKHIEQANEGIKKEFGIDASNYTADGVISQHDVISMMVDLSAFAVGSVEQQHIENVEAFLADNGLSGDFTADQIKALAKLDASMEGREIERVAKRPDFVPGITPLQ